MLDLVGHANCWISHAKALSFPVLGPSNPNWIEDATRRKQQQSMPVVRSYESVVDSPLLTPRISQICRDELQG